MLECPDVLTRVARICSREPARAVVPLKHILGHTATHTALLKKTKPQVIVLGKWAISVAPQSTKCLPPNHHSRMDDGSINEARHADVPWGVQAVDPRHITRHALARHPVRRSHIPHPSCHSVPVRTEVERSKLGSKPLREHAIISVTTRNQAPSSYSKANVERSDKARLRNHQTPYPRVPPRTCLCHLPACIGTAIQDNEEFPLGEGLGTHRCHGRTQGGLGVMYRKENGDLRNV